MYFHHPEEKKNYIQYPEIAKLKLKYATLPETSGGAVCCWQYSIKNQNSSSPLPGHLYETSFCCQHATPYNAEFRAKILDYNQSKYEKSVMGRTRLDAYKLLPEPIKNKLFETLIS